ncbi:MAG: hypothetical protein AAF602_15110 [Myxococcota bacterium]
MNISSSDFNGSSTAQFNGYGVPISAGSVVLTAKSGTGTVTVNLDPAGGVQR